MIHRRLLRPDRLRRVPPSFNGVDHRLIRDHYIERCDFTALAIYLFLVTVADAQGLSYYCDASLPSPGFKKTLPVRIRLKDVGLAVDAGHHTANLWLH